MKGGYFSRLAAALAGRTEAPAPGPIDDGGPWLDLQERDERIAAMRQEYEALRESSRREVEAAGQQELERAFKKLAGPLANLSALHDFSAAGGQVEVGDILTLVKNLTRECERLGLIRIGAAGEAADFDPVLHQRMSGGAVREGTRVVVELPGFRFGERVLSKAMVTAKEK